jgi:hypothetical protein
MVNIKHKRCEFCGLFIVNNKLCGCCNPNVRQNTKEMEIYIFLEETFPENKFIFPFL